MSDMAAAIKETREAARRAVGDQAMVQAQAMKLQAEATVEVATQLARLVDVLEHQFGTPVKWNRG